MKLKVDDELLRALQTAAEKILEDNKPLMLRLEVLSVRKQTVTVNISVGGSFLDFSSYGPITVKVGDTLTIANATNITKVQFGDF